MVFNKKSFAALAAATSMLLSTTAFANNPLIMAPGPQVPPAIYQIEQQPLYSTNMTNKGTLPQFTGLSDTALQDQLNKGIEDFYADLAAEGAKNGIPYPDLEITSEQYTTPKYFSLVVRGTLTYANAADSGEGEWVMAYVLDAQQPKRCTLTDLLGADAEATVNKLIREQIAQNPDGFFEGADGFNGITADTAFYVTNDSNLVIAFDKLAISAAYMGAPAFELTLPGGESLKLAQTADGYYVEDGIRMVPFRKIAENFGYTTTWDGTSGHVDNGVVHAVVTPGVNNYGDGNISLECAPVNKNGSIHVPASFFEKVLDISCVEDNGEITCAKIIGANLLPSRPVASGESIPATTAPAEATEDMEYKTINGSVIDATMHGVTIRTADGTEMHFGYPEADPNTINDIMLDGTIMVTYTGEITGTDTTGVEIVSIESATGKPGVYSIEGTIKDATMNGVTIETATGREMHFGTEDVNTTGGNGLIIGTKIAIMFTGEPIGEDTSNCQVVTISAR